MHRPVKNRDGGPIAGVAFNGGGASRQLGPDDNNPVSATQIPKASNHTIPLPPRNPSTTITLFPSPTTNAAHNKHYSSKISLLTSTFGYIFTSNRMSELATIRERRLLLCL